MLRMVAGGDVMRMDAATAVFDLHENRHRRCARYVDEFVAELTTDPIVTCALADGGRLTDVQCLFRVYVFERLSALRVFLCGHKQRK